jgi:endonuclease V-like protein UPF0215 family
MLSGSMIARLPVPTKAICKSLVWSAAQTRIEGILSTHIRKDGANATSQLEHLIWHAKFAPTLQLITL